MTRKLDKSDIATILAALRLFQETYENLDAEQIYRCNFRRCPSL